MAISAEGPEHGGIEHSPLHPHYEAKAGSRAGSGVSSASWERKPSSCNSGLAPKRYGSSRLPEKPAPIPKFGGWDENDPSAADGFTGIFHKVREDKPNRITNGVTGPQACSPCWDRKQAGSENSKRRRLLRAFDSWGRIRMGKSGGEMINRNDPDRKSSSSGYDDASICSEREEGNPYGQSTSGNVIYSDKVWFSPDNQSYSTGSPDQPDIVYKKKRRWLPRWWRKK